MDKVIPVAMQPEPGDFDKKVRQVGFAWLEKHQIDPNNPPLKASELPTYWQKSLEPLWEAYSGVCAYLAIFIEPIVSEATIDHFIPKSQNAGKAYEWGNFRLAILHVNRLKGEHVDVCDPMAIGQETFLLNLLSGEIFPNPSLTKEECVLAQNTIKRLHLDSPKHNRMRAERFSEYIAAKNEEKLQRLSPFIWYEAKRQGLL